MIRKTKPLLAVEAEDCTATISSPTKGHLVVLEVAVLIMRVGEEEAIAGLETDAATDEATDERYSGCEVQFPKRKHDIFAQLFFSWPREIGD